MESSKPRRARKMSPRPPVDLSQAPLGAPKVVTRSLVEIATEAGLDGAELSAFAEEQAKNLQALQLLNVKKNVTGLSLDKAELDALLSVLDAHAEKSSFAAAILKSAADAGMQPQTASQFAMKLARMGIHQ